MLVLRARIVTWPERRRPCHWRLASVSIDALIPLGKLRFFLFPSWPMSAVFTPFHKEADTMSPRKRAPAKVKPAKEKVSPQPSRPPRDQPVTLRVQRGRH